MQIPGRRRSRSHVVIDGIENGLIRRNPARVALLVACISAALVIGVSGWPFRKTDAEHIAISYGGGPFEGNQYQGIIRPGSSLKFNGWFDQFYEYPVSQRNYIVSLNADEGDRQSSDSITAFTSDRVQVKYEVAIYFKVNTQLLRSFHENLGLKYEAWNAQGWGRLLNDNFRQQLENALQLESRSVTAEQIATDPSVIQKMQLNLAKVMSTRMTSALGAEYFCGPTFNSGSTTCPDLQVVVKNAHLPDELVAAFQSQQASAAQIVTAQNQAKIKEEEARGVKLQQEALAGSITPEYLDLKRIEAEMECAKNPNCTLVVNGTSGGVNINTR